ncbi:MAG: hypothetical protein NVS1B6_04390 [Steroidobacteraceae bacterium]
MMEDRRPQAEPEKWTSGKLVSGQELLDVFGGLSSSMLDLDFIAKGYVKCLRCGGSGWHPKTDKQTFYVLCLTVGISLAIGVLVGKFLL